MSSPVGDNSGLGSPSPGLLSGLGGVNQFLWSGVGAILSFSVAAPLERVKLLLQTQEELLKTGRLKHSFDGLRDCFGRIVHYEGFDQLWRGNFANVLKYYPSQSVYFLMHDLFCKTSMFPKECSGWKFVVYNVFGGIAAGILSSPIVYTLDYARTRLAVDLRVQPTPGATNPIKHTQPLPQREFSGLGDVYLKTLKGEGIRGLYRGFLVSCVGMAIYRGLYFGMFESFKPVVEREFTGKGGYLEFSGGVLLGWAVAIVASFAAYPFDTIRRKMMIGSLNSDQIKYKSAWDCYMHNLSVHKGPLFLFRGAYVNVLRSFAGGVALAIYDLFHTRTTMTSILHSGNYDSMEKSLHK